MRRRCGGGAEEVPRGCGRGARGVIEEEVHGRRGRGNAEGVRNGAEEGAGGVGCRSWVQEEGGSPLLDWASVQSIPRVVRADPATPKRLVFQPTAAVATLRTPSPAISTSATPLVPTVTPCVEALREPTPPAGGGEVKRLPPCVDTLREAPPAWPPGVRR